jgi:hypothetical protein
MSQKDRPHQVEVSRREVLKILSVAGAAAVFLESLIQPQLRAAQVDKRMSLLSAPDLLA